MRNLILAAAACLLIALTLRVNRVHAAQVATPEPAKVAAVPADYREWVYLTSGLDMTYAAASTQARPHTPVFDNVFVNPEAWRTFKQTGTWPDGTTFVLENRKAEQNVSINRAGHTQGPNITGIELHQKRHNAGAFYDLEQDGAEHLVARPASCYTCHEGHAAVDTTFAQFYPTAMPIAQQHGTVSAAYLAEHTEASQK